MEPKPYSVRPRQKDRLSFFLIALALLATVAAFSVASIFPVYRSLTQCAGLLALTAAVYLMVRNRMPVVYTVEAEENGEVYDLVISYARPWRRVTACRLAIDDIREIDLVDRNTKDAIRQKYQNDTVHNYCPTLFPEQSAYLRFADSNPYASPSATEENRDLGTTRVVIRIACNPTILAMLRSRLA